MHFEPIRLTPHSILLLLLQWQMLLLGLQAGGGRTGRTHQAAWPNKGLIDLALAKLLVHGPIAWLCPLLREWKQRFPSLEEVAAAVAQGTLDDTEAILGEAAALHSRKLRIWL